MAKKPGQVSGYTKGLAVAAKIAEAVDLSFKLKIKEEKLYRDEGFDTWEAYCKEVLGTGADALDRKLKTIKDLGLEAVKVMHSIGQRPQQLALLLTDDQKHGLREGVLKVGDREIVVRAENAEDIQAAVDAILRESEKESKSARHEAQKRTTERDALAHRIKRYDEYLPGPEKATKAMNQVAYCEMCYQQLDSAMNYLVFEAMELEDATSMAAVEGLIAKTKARLLHFEDKFREHIK